MSEQVEYAYDVFVSYADADEEWVCVWLVPRLLEAGLKVYARFRNSKVGKPKIDDRAWGVDNSHRTLLVLTPAWLESELANFEALLAQATDPAGRRRRLLPLFLKPCQISGTVGMLTSADFTQQDKWETELERVVAAFRGDQFDPGIGVVRNQQGNPEPLGKSHPADGTRIPDIKPRAHAGPVVDRKKESKEIIDALSEGKSVNVFGDSGVGKTTLANEAVHKLSEGQFPGGVLWLFPGETGEGRTLADIVTDIADRYHAESVLRAREQSRVKELQEFLSHKRALIVVDLALSDDVVHNVLRVILHPCTLLITSQERVSSGMIYVPLGRFDRETAGELFVQITEAEKGDRTIQGISRAIYEWTGGLPCVIEELAWQARREGNIPRFFRRLQEDRLSRRSDRPAGEETTYRRADALSTIWNMLDESSRRLLTVLTVFRAAADPDAITFVSQLTKHIVADVLRTLQQLRLVRASSPRYYLSPFVKGWARTRLVDKEDSYRRMAEYYLQYAQDNRDDTVTEHFDALELERANLQAGLSWCVQADEWALVAQYVDALNQHWLSTNWWREFKDSMANAIEAGRRLSRPDIEAWAHHQLGSILLCQGEIRDASEHLESACNLLKKGQEKVPNLSAKLARTFHNLGVLYEMKNEIERATTCYGKSRYWKWDPELPTLQYLEKFLDKGPTSRDWAIEGVRIFDEERAFQLRLHDLESESKQIRVLAVKGLGRLGSTRALDALTKVLEDPDHDVVREAIVTLGNIGTPSVVLELSKLWDHPDPDVRSALVGTEPLFIEASKSQEPGGRNVAFEGLVRIGTSGAISRIVTAMSDERTYESASRALRLINKPQALPVLIDSMGLARTQPAWEVLSDTIAESGQLALPPLRHKLDIKQPFWFQSAVVRTIGKINDPVAASTLGEMVRDTSRGLHVQMEATKAIERLIQTDEWTFGQVAVPLKEALLDPAQPRKVRSAVAEVLGSSGNPAVIQPLIEASKSRGLLHTAALEGIKKIDKPEAIQQLVKSLSLDMPRRTQEVLSDKIAGFGQQALQFLEGELKTTHLPATQSRVVRTIGKMSDPVAASTLGEMVKDTSRGLHVQMEAVKAVGPFIQTDERAFDQAVIPLREALLDPVQPTKVRSEVAKVLGSSGNPFAIPPLIQASRSQEPHIQTAALEGLGRINIPDAIPGLVSALSLDMPRPTQEVALEKIAGFGRQALPFLATVDNPGVLRTLGTMAGDTSRDLQIREAATKTIGQIGSGGINTQMGEQAVRILQQLRRNQAPVVATEAKKQLRLLGG